MTWNRERFVIAYLIMCRMTLKLTSVNGSSKGCPLPTPTGPSTALSPACLGEGEGYSIYNKQVWAVEFPDGDTGWEPSPIIIILNVIYMSFLCQSHLGSSPKDHAGKFHCQRVPEVLISKVQGVLIKKSSFSGLSPARIKSVPEKTAAAITLDQHHLPRTFLEAIDLREADSYAS